MIYKYYLEIKNRCFLLLLTWFSTIFVGYIYRETLLFSCVKSNVYYDSNDAIFYFIFTDIKEIFSVYLTLVFFVGNQVLMFFFIFHILAFISLGLYKFEYKYLKSVFSISIFFWFFSLIIFNKILFPISLHFFLSFQSFNTFKYLHLHFEAKLNEYLNFYIMFYYICAFYCQIFVIFCLFVDYINTDRKLIRRFRKLFYYLFIFFSTLVTPPDVISQILVSISLIFVYELLIFINLLFLNIRKTNLVAN